MPSRRLILPQACPSTTKKKVTGSKTGIWLLHSFRNGSPPMSPSFGRCRSRIMPSTWALQLGLAQLVTDGLRRAPHVLECARASAPPRRVWSKDLSLSRYMPRLYAATIAENLALQRLSAGPFHSIPSALLRRGSACGLKIDADGIQLTTKAARFRVTSQSAVLSTGMDRIRAAKDYCGGTLDSFTRSWDDKYFHTSTAHFTASTLR